MMMPLQLSIRDILSKKLPGRRVPECIVRYLERITHLERYHRDREGLFAPYRPVPTRPLANDPFEGDDPVENYHILQRTVRELGTVIPPMFTAYMNLTGKLRFFGNAINDELADVYESGVMVDTGSIYRDKINRYISPYIEWQQGINS